MPVLDIDNEEELSPSSLLDIDSAEHLSTILLGVTKPIAGAATRAAVDTVSNFIVEFYRYCTVAKNNV
jgi:hypothetical protein